MVPHKWTKLAQIPLRGPYELPKICKADAKTSSAEGMVAPYAGPVAMKLSLAQSRASGTSVFFA